MRKALSKASAAMASVVLCCLGCTPSDTPKPELDAELALPMIPWEGGSQYWKSFAKADAAGWDDPAFFPIAIWYNGISNDEEVRHDKAHGINTYMGMDASTPSSIFEQNDVYWIGGQLNDTFTSETPNWVGAFLDDEVDGRFTPEEGRKHLQTLAEAVPDGYFKYANFTQMVISHYMDQTDAQQFVNDYTDTVSVDMYWYTIPYCSLRPYNNAHIAPVTEENCRTATSYGKTMKALRMQDEADGKLQPLWQFVENLNGGPGEGPFVANISPGQLKGAVMNSLINEARGIVYFNQSLTGPCGGGSVLRLSQVTSGFCGAEQMAGMKQVNQQISDLAPVLNTQSYDFSFGSGLDTMLKAFSGHAYIFAMTDDSGTPGPRTFQLPPEIRADSVEVLYEDRTLPVDGEGKFVDSFDAEYSYHIYKAVL